MTAWPPTLDDVLNDMKKDDPALEISPQERQRLTTVLDAAVEEVEGALDGSYNFTGDLGSGLPDPGPRVRLGTVRLAVRWHIRSRSPDGLVDMGEQGSSRIPAYDPDIERLLGLGRYRRSEFA